MGKASNLRTKVGRNRVLASVLGTVAALPAFLIAFFLIFAATQIITAQARQSGSNPLVQLVATLIFGWVFLVVGRWSFTGVRAALTGQPVQVMWLRRFQSESGEAFRTSQVIDRLSRFGISSLTLQDRDVRLSFEQRRNRLAGVFWSIFPPIVIVVETLVLLAFNDAMKRLLAEHPNYPTAHSVGEGIQIVIVALITGALKVLTLELGFLFIGLAASFLAATAVVTLAVMLGPIGERLSSRRDDFVKLPGLLARILKGKRARGSVVLRISDAHWQEAVTSSLSASDVAIIDLSSISSPILWEIAQATAACGPSGIVYIGRSGVDFRQGLAGTDHAGLIGDDNSRVIVYPKDNRQGKAAGERFALALREAIYTAYAAAKTAG